MARKPATKKPQMTASEKKSGVPACVSNSPEIVQDLWLKFIDSLCGTAKLIPFSADVMLEEFSVLVDCEIPNYQRSICFGNPTEKCPTDEEDNLLTGKD